MGQEVEAGTRGGRPGRMDIHLQYALGGGSIAILPARLWEHRHHAASSAAPESEAFRVPPVPRCIHVLQDLALLSPLRQTYRRQSTMGWQLQRFHSCASA